MTTIPLEQLIQMREGMTEGEWSVQYNDHPLHSYVMSMYITGARATIPTCIADEMNGGPARLGWESDANAKAIAALPTILDMLIERENKLRELAKKWRTQKNYFACIETQLNCAEDLESLLEKSLNNLQG